MSQDLDYFVRRAAEARSAAANKGDPEGIEVAGHLALAYAAMARRRRTARPDSPGAVDPVAASRPDPQPMMLRTAE